MAAASSRTPSPLFRPHIAEGLHLLHCLATSVLEEAQFLSLSARDHDTEMAVDDTEDDGGTDISKVFVCVLFLRYVALTLRYVALRYVKINVTLTLTLTLTLRYVTLRGSQRDRTGRVKTAR